MQPGYRRHYSANAERTFLQAFKPGNHTQRRSFPASRWSNERDDFTWMQAKRYVLGRGTLVTIFMAQAIDDQSRRILALTRCTRLF